MSWPWPSAVPKFSLRPVHTGSRFSPISSPFWCGFHLEQAQETRKPGAALSWACGMSGMSGRRAPVTQLFRKPWVKWEWILRVKTEAADPKSTQVDLLKLRLLSQKTSIKFIAWSCGTILASAPQSKGEHYFSRHCVCSHYMHSLLKGFTVP